MSYIKTESESDTQAASARAFHRVVERVRETQIRIQMVTGTRALCLGQAHSQSQSQCQSQCQADPDGDERDVIKRRAPLCLDKSLKINRCVCVWSRLEIMAFRYWNSDLQIQYNTNKTQATSLPALCVSFSLPSF